MKHLVLIDKISVLYFDFYSEDRLESIRSIFSGKADQIRTPDEQWYYKKVGELNSYVLFIAVIILFFMKT